MLTRLITTENSDRTSSTASAQSRNTTAAAWPTSDVLSTLLRGHLVHNDPSAFGLLPESGFDDLTTPSYRPLMLVHIDPLKTPPESLFSMNVSLPELASRTGQSLDITIEQSEFICRADSWVPTEPPGPEGWSEDPRQGFSATLLLNGTRVEFSTPENLLHEIKDAIPSLIKTVQAKGFMDNRLLFGIVKSAHFGNASYSADGGAVIDRSGLHEIEMDCFVVEKRDNFSHIWNVNSLFDAAISNSDRYRQATEYCAADISLDGSDGSYEFSSIVYEVEADPLLGRSVKFKTEDERSDTSSVSDLSLHESLIAKSGLV